MKKNLVLSLSFILLVGFIVIISSTSATIDFWSKTEGEAGVLRAQNGTTFKQPDHKQLIDIIESIDPVTDFTPVAKNYAEGLKRKTIKLDGRNGIVDLEFDYVINEGELTVFPRSYNMPGTGYQITEIPYSNEIIIEHEGILYLANVLEEEIKLLLNSEVDGYSLTQAIEHSRQLSEDGNDPFVWWGSRASVNPSGTKLVFFTTRSGDNEIWIKDLKNGEEKKLLNSHLNVNKWVNDDEFVFSESGNIFKFNILTGVKDYYGKSSIVDVNDQYVILQEKDGYIEFFSLYNDEHINYENPGLNYIRAFATFENSPWVAALNQKKRESIDSELYLINTEDFSTKVLEIPDYVIAQTIQWKNSDELYLLLSDKVDNREETKIINLNEL